MPSQSPCSRTTMSLPGARATTTRQRVQCTNPQVCPGFWGHPEIPRHRKRHRTRSDRVEANRRRRFGPVPDGAYFVLVSHPEGSPSVSNESQRFVRCPRRATCIAAGPRAGAPNRSICAALAVPCARSTWFSVACHDASIREADGCGNPNGWPNGAVGTRGASAAR